MYVGTNQIYIKCPLKSDRAHASHDKVIIDHMSGQGYYVTNHVC